MKIWTAEKINDFLKVNRPGIIIIASTFKNINTKACFIDSEFGEWWTAPVRVIHNSVTHPGRRIWTSKQINDFLKVNRPNITMVESTFKNVNTKACFIDLEFGEWLATPIKIIKGSNHPKKKLPHSLSIEEVEKRLQKKIPGLTIDKSTYTNTGNKCRLLHSDFGEWWTVPKDVIAGKSRRPKSKRLAEIEKEISNISGFDWTIDQSTFVDACTKARFFNNKNEEWWIEPTLITSVSKNYMTPFEKRSSFDIEKEIQKDQPYISIDHTAYKNTHELCCFIDSEYGEFWAKVHSILGGGGHAKRAGNEPLTIDDIKYRLVDKPYISIDETSFISASKNARFIDSEYGEFFAKPIEVTRIKNGKSHPKRCNRGLELVFHNLTGIEIFDKKPEFLKGSQTLLRVDFKLSDDIYVETDGLYWHSEQVIPDKWHHFKRRELFEKHNKRLIQFREDEIHNKPEIVKSIVCHLAGKTENKIFPRKCIIIENVCSKFFEENHLMGYIAAKAIGLAYNNVIVCAMSYKIIKKELHIMRFCNALNTQIIGGFSKLLSYLEKSLQPNRIINFVDLRYGSGKHLLSLGFILQGVTLGWCWTNTNSTFNRLKCRANMDARKLTQAEHAKEMKLFKIYDAGQAKYVKNCEITN